MIDNIYYVKLNPPYRDPSRSFLLPDMMSDYDINTVPIVGLTGYNDILSEQIDRHARQFQRILTTIMRIQPEATPISHEFAFILFHL